MNRRSTLGWVALVLVVLVAGLLVVSPAPRSDRPLDPRAAGPQGARAVVVLLEELGADVVVSPRVPDEAATALLLDDVLDEADRDRLRSWVRRGGLLVVADDSSPFTALVASAVGAGCPDELASATTLAFAPGAGGFLERDEQCYGGTVRSAAVGDGRIVAVSTPRIFVNDLLDEADNAVAAAALLAPTGHERVAFVHGAAGSGERGLLDLLGPRTRQALTQAGIAAAVYVLWRARRLGRPVPERQPVRVAGSELVAAVGRLLGARRRPADAAETVRAALRRDLERRLGLPLHVPAEVIAEALAGRAGLDPAWVAAALARPVGSDDELVAVVADLDRIRTLVLEPATTLPEGATP